MQGRHPVDAQQLILPQWELNEQRRSDDAILMQTQVLGLGLSSHVDHDGHSRILRDLQILQRYLGVSLEYLGDLLGGIELLGDQILQLFHFVLLLELLLLLLEDDLPDLDGAAPELPLDMPEDLQRLLLELLLLLLGLLLLDLLETVEGALAELGDLALEFDPLLAFGGEVPAGLLDLLEQVLPARGEVRLVDLGESLAELGVHLL